MAQIAFLLLCHKDAAAIIQKARQLTAAGDVMAIHVDANAPKAVWEEVHGALAGNPAITFAPRVRCGWGEWSLVQATLNAAEAALATFPEATHFYLLSGDCMAIKSAAWAHELLERDPADYIESFDFHESDWIKTGIKDERLTVRHWFNERRQKWLFYRSIEAQRALGLTRRPPADLTIQIGSQWWCLRRATLEGVLAFLAERPDVTRFFRTTWIPDETFFQTLVRHLVPEAEIRCRTLTFLMFTDYGMPVTFYNDHYDLLLGQDYLFARKISPEATELKGRLGDLWASGRTEFPISNEGRRLFAFLTGRGRIGRRFAPRFWEAGMSMGRERVLYVIASKKWHVAKRLVGAIREATGLPCLDYIFNEEETPLPDLGGIQSSIAKRTRHRRAMMRMLFDHHGTDRLLICLDTSGLDHLQDFAADRCELRVLEIDPVYSDAFLTGHARRMGLIGAGTDAAGLARLLPTLRHDIAYEVEGLRSAGLPHHDRLREGASEAELARTIADFLQVGQEEAARIAATPDLFAD
ncbi:DUF5928 domain-containing protein [Pseudoroseicyclus tamaricis]|uniref:Peptide O-xylosyltransferase n=1 Tax=Pseudoroseicyclus tamaricis TaxID=2705421 RepID=A0A6B2K519_9RHOB|nr:DUF5928 domain-containing protein [Pseudoroseicyclus tamaricis]NDV01826.1 beta-1,6-N-acetylglucosaminyltransferase [Pseudoroseicyclus tamaricis]